MLARSAHSKQTFLKLLSHQEEVCLCSCVMAISFHPCNFQGMASCIQDMYSSTKRKYIKNGILGTTAQLNCVEKAQIHYSNKPRAPSEMFLSGDVFLIITQTFWSLWRQVSKLESWLVSMSSLSTFLLSGSKNRALVHPGSWGFNVWEFPGDASHGKVYWWVLPGYSLKLKLSFFSSYHFKQNQTKVKAIKPSEG